MTTEVRKLYRSQSDRLISGVCGGMGDFFGIDPTLMRIIFVLLAIFGGSGIIIYLVMLLIVPEEPLGQVSQSPEAQVESTNESTEV